MLDIKSIEGLTSLPKLSVQKELTQRTNVLVVVLTQETLSQPPAFVPVLSSLAEELKTKKNLVLYGGKDDLYGVSFIRTVSFSTNYEIFEAAGDLTRALLAEKVSSVSISFPQSVSAENITTFITGVSLTNYKYNRKSDEFKRISSIEVISGNFNPEDKQTKFALESTRYSLFCRQILNLRPLDANPETMLELCRNIAKIDPKVTIEAIVDKELEAKGLNLIYAVGRGAARRPCLVNLKYEGNPNNSTDVIALVGKGVCFDAGGLNLKPTKAIEEMWMDKGGACAVLSTFKAVVEQKLPVNLVASLAFVENLVGSDCYHPSDIIKSHKGLTVEIGNTDAEGRLILCDAMSYTQQVYKPNTLIEFSTLTGAVMMALGLTTAGLFSNSDELSNDLIEASSASVERIYRLPIFEEHRKNMKGKFSDLNNIAPVPYGGASNAGAYLECFVEKDVKWAHIDIAGVASANREFFVYSEAATGFGVRLTLEYLTRRIAKH